MISNPKDLSEYELSSKSFSTAMLLAMFLGIFGIHRLYLKRYPIGIAMLSAAVTCALSLSTVFIFTFIHASDPSLAGQPLPSWITGFMFVGITSYVLVFISAVIALIDMLMLSLQQFNDGDGHLVLPKVDSFSDKSYAVTIILLLFLGCLGIHRFYTGRYITGALMFITFGGFGVWWLVDMVMIATLNFKDAHAMVVAYS